MELGLTLGDASKPFGYLKQKQQQKPTITNKTGFNLCMALGLNSSPVANKTHKSSNEEEEEQDDENEDEYDDNQTSDDEVETPLQLNLLPLALAPAPARRPWSSDNNGSSENGSSGNMGMTTGKGLNVNKVLGSTATEEVSSANSPFNNGIFRGFGDESFNCSKKRDFEALATGNDAVEGVRGSDDDDDNGNARKKLRLSKEQSAFLEESFKEHNTLNPKQKQALANQLNLRPRQVEVWFQNRRARTKLKQTEVDCEYLKRCCETLTEENRRLQKELQDLRALKTSNPFNIQRPATTLTMCPSCERVATTNATVVPHKPKAGKADHSVPFDLTRPKFYPFSQTQKHPNQSAAS